MKRLRTSAVRPLPILGLLLVALVLGLRSAPTASVLAADVVAGSDVLAQGAQEEPAVVLEEPPPPVEDLPWTYRYLVPTGLALAALTLVAIVVGYFVKVVRARYRIVR